MITKDGSIVRVAPIVDTSAIRQAVLDEDWHIKELSAAEWGKFSWDEVRVFMHEYPVYVLPTTELLDVLEDLTCDYKTIEIGAGSGSIGRLLGIKMTDSYMQQDNEAVRKYYESLGQPIIKYPRDVIKADVFIVSPRFWPESLLGWMGHCGAFLGE